VGEPADAPHASIAETDDNGEVLDALASGAAQVAAGTGWLWAREEFHEAVDVLFVDEAGQLTLADVLAVSQAAQSVVLLGDPQQLGQPLQGSHPEGTDASALEHILDAHKTMPAERGLFLDQTWRLHPKICAFTSELFGEPDENPFGAPDVAEPIRVLIPDHFADELRAALAEPGERIVDVLHGEHHT
jgi:uncharacterized protein